MARTRKKRTITSRELDLKKCLAVAVRAAKLAGAIQKKKVNARHTIRLKGPRDLVTEVDGMCQKTILKIIEAQFPEHDFIAEEEGANRRTSDYRWLIDPLDGTTNFAHGYPAFTVSIGLEVKGELVVGVVHHMPLNETFTAIRGKGAFLNGKRIRCSSQAVLGDALMCTGFPHPQDLARRNLANFSEVMFKVQGIRRGGSAALDMAYVACGRLDGYWDISLKSWDMAAGSLLVREAGGVVTALGGRDFSVYHDEIVAAGPALHGQLLPLVK